MAKRPVLKDISDDEPAGGNEYKIVHGDGTGVGHQSSACVKDTGVFSGIEAPLQNVLLYMGTGTRMSSIAAAAKRGAQGLLVYAYKPLNIALQGAF